MVYLQLIEHTLTSRTFVKTYMRSSSRIVNSPSTPELDGEHMYPVQLVSQA